MPAKYLLAAAAVAVLVLGGVAAADAALANTGKQKVVENETFTPAAAGGHVSLNFSDLDGVRYAPETEIQVFDENNTEMIAGEDYDWVRTNGSIQILSGGRLVGDSDATITYGYGAPTTVQRSLAEVFGGGAETASLFVLVITVLFVVVSLRAVGVMGG